MPRRYGGYEKRRLEYGHSGNYDLAIADFGKALLLDPQYVMAYYNRGRVYQEKENYAKAFTDYSAAIQIDPMLVSAYVNRGGLHITGQDWGPAIVDLDMAIQLAPDHATAYYSLGEAYLELEDYDQAIANFDTALQLNPDDENIHIVRGNTHLRNGDYDLAIVDCSAAIHIVPDAAEAYMCRGEARGRKGWSIRDELDDYIAGMHLDASYAQAHSDIMLSYIAQDVPADVDQCGEDFAQPGTAHGMAVFVPTAVFDVMPAVFNAPMAAKPAEQVRRTTPSGRGAGQQIPAFLGQLAGGQGQVGFSIRRRRTAWRAPRKPSSSRR